VNRSVTITTPPSINFATASQAVRSYNSGEGLPLRGVKLSLQRCLFSPTCYFSASLASFSSRGGCRCARHADASRRRTSRGMFRVMRIHIGCLRAALFSKRYVNPIFGKLLYPVAHSTDFVCLVRKRRDTSPVFRPSCKASISSRAKSIPLRSEQEA